MGKLKREVKALKKQTKQLLSEKALEILQEMAELALAENSAVIYPTSIYCDVIPKILKEVKLKFPQLNWEWEGSECILVISRKKLESGFTLAVS